MSIEERATESDEWYDQKVEQRPSELPFFFQIVSGEVDKYWSDDCELIGEKVHNGSSDIGLCIDKGLLLKVSLMDL